MFNQAHADCTSYLKYLMPVANNEVSRENVENVSICKCSSPDANNGT
jgi:hypothetical protein